MTIRIDNKWSPRSYCRIMWHLFRYWLLRTGTIKSPSLAMLRMKPAAMHATITEYGIQWSNRP